MVVDWYKVWYNQTIGQRTFYINKAREELA